MGTTPNYAWPYPEGSQKPLIPTHMRSLADAIDATTKTVDNKAIAAQASADANTIAIAAIPQIQAGSTVLTATGGAGTKAVTFPTPFAAAPAASTNINNGSAASAGGDSRGISLSAGSFTVFVFGATQTYTPEVTWIAIQRTAAPTFAAMQTAATDPAPEGWHYVTATCHTDGCSKQDEPVHDVLIPDVPEDWGWNGVECGACHQEITDLVPQ